MGGSQSSTHSSISPGWHSRALHRASIVDILMAFALPVLSMDRFWGVIPTLAASSPEDIFLLASITSILITIAITDYSFSGCG